MKAVFLEDTIGTRLQPPMKKISDSSWFVKKMRYI